MSSNPIPPPAPQPQFIQLDNPALSQDASASIWDRISSWVAEHKAVVYTIAGVTVVATAAGVYYYYSTTPPPAPKDTETATAKKKAKKARRKAEKEAEEASKNEANKTVQGLHICFPHEIARLTVQRTQESGRRRRGRAPRDNGSYGRDTLSSGK
jgi:hypothetical protein